MIIPVDYPMKAPSIKFDGKFWHPNISKQNEFLDILKNSWSPTMSIKNALNSLYVLLCRPEDSCSTEVDHEFKSSKSA